MSDAPGPRSGDARIAERGWRAYEGPRLGVRGAQRSLVRHSIRRALGIKRPLWAKALPLASVVIAYLPAIVFVGVVALLPDEVEDGFLPTYGQYYSFVTAAIVLFTAFVAPEVLCPDRRGGLLGLYLASPLDRRTYLQAKATAVVVLLALVTLGPPLFLLLANVLQGEGPDGPLDVLIVCLRIVVGAVVISGLHAALSLAVSSLTDRRAVASAGIILALLVSSAFVGVLIEGLDGPSWLVVFDLFTLPFELVVRVFGEPGEAADLRDVPVAVLAVANAAWTVLGAAVVWIRYRRLVVAR